MAVTADTVEVRLRADTAQYVRNLNQADAAFTRSANTITTNSARIQQAGDSARSSFSGVAAQFQDIGVTAAAGMNPLIIALQQGTQLSAQLQQSAANGQGVFRSLATGVAGLLNPISLTTIAAIALGTALLQSLGSLVPKAESGTQAIKRHREELENVVRGYGAAEDAVTNYFDQVERLPQFAATEQVRKQFSELEKAATSLPGKLQDVSDYIRALGPSATDTYREILRLVEEFQAGGISLEDLYSQLGAASEGMGILESAVGRLGLGATKTIGGLRSLILTVSQFGDEYARFMALTQIELGLAKTDQELSNALNLRSYIADQQRINGLTSEQLSLEQEIARIKADAGNLGITDERARELALETLAAEERRAQIRKDATSGARAATEYERERQAITDLLAAMGLEAALLGQNNREKAIAIALSKANATATQEELNAISQTAGFIYDTEQALKGLNDTSQEWANTIQSATRGFINDLVEGKTAAEAFGNVLSRIANQLLDVGLDNLFGSKGFNLAGLFGGTSTRATGGPVYAGNPTLVGEKGPEVFIPSGPGRIVPNSQLGGGSTPVAFNIDARGADTAAIARLETVVQKLASDIVPTIRTEMATAAKKGR